MIKRILVEQGAQVELANNGQEALDKALSGSFHTILMDIQMPKMDGYEVTERLRKSDVKTPIIALTAHAMSDEREKCLRKGCNEFLVKPLDFARLIQIVFEQIKAVKR